MRRTVTVWLRVVLAALVFLGLGLGCFSLRRAFIATWFRDAAPALPPHLPQPDSGADGTRSALADGGNAGPGAVLRVVLIDGLGRDHAEGLPALSRFCRGGLDLTVDVGFPTVSLPVQAALWTGRTQAQLGLLYRIKPLSQPPLGALPARVPDSVAIAEDQKFIAGSFGFASLLPASTEPTWADAGFLAAARAAATSSASLVFVHLLRVDKAGHKTGAGSAEYRAATLWADGVVDQLVSSAPPSDGTRWVVLSDHGHRARGGHAGAEPAIRFVRACVAGGPPATFIQVPKAEPFTVHLVDLARLLSDSLALAPAPGSVGRPLAFARAHPGFGATLPSRGWGRVVVAAAFVLMALVAAAAWLRRTCRQRGSRVGPRLSLWLWVPVALAGIFALRGWPSLSTPAIYPPQGRDLVIAALPGLLGLVGWLCALAWPGGKRRPHDARHTATALAGFALVPGIALGLASLSVCGAFVPLFDSSAGPPLSPLAAPLASMTLAVLGGAALLLALVAPALDVAAQVRASRPDSRKAGTDVEERDDRREKRDS